MKNVEIRVMVYDSKLHYKDIAEYLGISPEWLSRLMRYELTPKNEERIVNAVSQLLKIKEHKNTIEEAKKAKRIAELEEELKKLKGEKLL